MAQSHAGVTMQKNEDPWFGRMIAGGALAFVLAIGFYFTILAAPPETRNSDVAAMVAPDPWTNPDEEQTLDRLVEEALSDTEKRTVVYNATRELPFEQDTRVRIAVSREDMLGRRAMIGLSGSVESDTAELTRRVRADLTASNTDVTIVPIGPMEKTLRDRTATEFTFNVRPKTMEPFTLYFQLTNMATVAGEKHSADGSTWNREVLVNATLWQRAAHWWRGLDLIWQVLGMIVTIAGVGALAVKAWQRLAKAPAVAPPA